MGQEVVITRTLDELRGRTLEDVLNEVVQNKEPMTVLLDEGSAVVIRPALELRPLRVLDGRVPEGWKDAIYSE
jgi:hypothetical protein